MKAHLQNDASYNLASRCKFSIGLVNTDQVKDYLKTLMEWNDQRVNSIKKKFETSQSDEASFVVLPIKHSTAELIIHLCNLWKLSNEVKFTAIAIYDQFISSLLSDIYKTIYGTTNHVLKSSRIDSSTVSKYKGKSRDHTSSSNNNVKTENQNNQWEETIKHVAGQMELRAVTCISIASKFFSHYSHVTYNMAVNYLASKGLKYKPGVFLKSEVRVLKALKFNVSSVPVVLPYIAAILDCLLEKDATLLGKEVYSLCIDLLGCFYPRRYQVYEKYLICVVKTKSEEELHCQIAELANDMVLLSCGIVTSAVYLWFKRKSDSVIELMSHLTNATQNTIAQFSYILLDESLK